MKREGENGKLLGHTPSGALLLCPASHWGVLPSEGTEAHSVLLLKTLFAPYLRGTKRVERYYPLSPPETGGVPKGKGSVSNV